MIGEKRNKHQAKRYTCINWRKHITAKTGILKNSIQHPDFSEGLESLKGILIFYSTLCNMGKFMLCSKHVSGASKQLCNVMWMREKVGLKNTIINSFLSCYSYWCLHHFMRVELKKILCVGLICKYVQIPFLLSFEKYTVLFCVCWNANNATRKFKLDCIINNFWGKSTIIIYP